MPEYGFSVIQFLIARSVDEQLKASSVRDRAIRGGVLPENARYETSTKSVPPTMTRITCHRPMAAAIVEEITELAADATGELLLDYVAAARAGLSALAPADRKP